MSGSCTSSNPPPLIFTSWPVATSACLQQIGRQTWWRGGRGRHTEKLAHLWRRGNSRGPARSVCTDFELLCMSMKVGSGLQKKFSGPRDGFWCLQEKKKEKKKKEHKIMLQAERRLCRWKSAEASVALGLYLLILFCCPLTSAAWHTV